MRYLWSPLAHLTFSTLFQQVTLVHGRIRLKLDLRALVDGSLAPPLDSATHKIGDVSWSLNAHRMTPDSLIDAPELGLYLKCYGLPNNQEWRRDAYAVMRIVAQLPGVDDIRRSTGCTFKSSAFNWGFQQFASCLVSRYRQTVCIRWNWTGWTRYTGQAVTGGCGQCFLAFGGLRSNQFQTRNNI